MTDPAGQIFFLLRFFCFMAVFYLVLHKLVARLSSKPESKLLWFFDILTAPLIAPVKRWSNGAASKDQLISKALIAYAVLWLLLIVIGRRWSG